MRLGDGRGMRRQAKKRARRRCCECRSWYRPAPSATKTQKTCSKACRLRRRAKQEKARREADLEATRRLERERQRRHRERKAEAVECAQMSRAGLSAKAREALEEILVKLGHEQRMSRDGLGRRLRRLALGETEVGGAKTGT